MAEAHKRIKLAAVLIGTLMKNRGEREVKKVLNWKGSGEA